MGQSNSMTDSTVKIASTVYKPCSFLDKVCFDTPKELGHMLSFAECGEELIPATLFHLRVADIFKGIDIASLRSPSRHICGTSVKQQRPLGLSTTFESLLLLDPLSLITLFLHQKQAQKCVKFLSKHCKHVIVYLKDYHVITDTD